MKPLNVFLQVIFPGKSVLATVALYSDFLSHFSFFVNALNTFTVFVVFVNEVELKFALGPGTRSRG